MTCVYVHTKQNKFLKLMGGKKPGNDAGGRQENPKRLCKSSFAYQMY